MNILGIAFISLGAVLAFYATVGSLLGQRLQVAALITSARRSIYMACFASLAAVATLIAAFVSNEFSIQYVYEHSSTTMSKALIWVAFYAGNEGSLLYILTALTVMSALAVFFTNRKLRPALPYTVLILGALQVFYFVVLLFFANPFALGDFLTTPMEGRGINPLLRHPGMFIHPPLLMAGLVGMGIPFAIVNGALMSGEIAKDAWVDSVRVWGIAVWALLGAGMLVGAWWAYTILGWGGYWGWDPIENVALMPWLVMTAFIHSIMVQKRRGIFRAWNVGLLGIAFVIAQLGLFINRGGPVVSVHSFGASTIGAIFLGFMIVSAVVTIVIFVWNWSKLKSNRQIDSLLSREIAILINTFMMLLSMVVILWGVIFPVFSNLTGTAEITVAAPYFNRTVGPVLLFTLLLMGIGPLLPWRKGNLKQTFKLLIPPLVMAAITVVILLAFGIFDLLALLAFAVLAIAFGAVMVEWWRGIKVGWRAGKLPWVAWWLMVKNNRPRHGGYIVHIAMLAFALGVVGTQFFDQRTDVSLALGQSAVLDNYRVEYEGLENGIYSDRSEQIASLNVYALGNDSYALQRQANAGGASDGFVLNEIEIDPNDQFITTLNPWQAVYSSYNIAAVRSGIRSTINEDLYIIPRNVTPDGNLVLGISINPLAIWLWIAGPIFLVGTVIALWPSRKDHIRARRRERRRESIGED